MWALARFRVVDLEPSSGQNRDGASISCPAAGKEKLPTFNAAHIPATVATTR